MIFGNLWESTVLPEVHINLLLCKKKLTGAYPENSIFCVVCAPYCLNYDYDFKIAFGYNARIRGFVNVLLKSGFVFTVRR